MHSNTLKKKAGGGGASPSPPSSHHHHTDLLGWLYLVTDTLLRDQSPMIPQPNPWLQYISPRRVWELRQCTHSHRLTYQPLSQMPIVRTGRVKHCTHCLWLAKLYPTVPGVASWKSPHPQSRPPGSAHAHWVGFKPQSSIPYCLVSNYSIILKWEAN